jgi:glycosyltransferase involved in cell wall biosynthesis
MHWFIVPDLDGPITGGTLFNRMLIEALRESGTVCNILSLATAPAVLTRVAPRDTFWVDSLYLDAFSGLVRAAAGTVPVALIAHYLPSLIVHGGGTSPADLTRAEAETLRVAAGFLVPSPFMRHIVERFAGAERPIVHVEPGRLARGCVAPPAPPMRAVMVANLVPGKGVDRFLRCLAGELLATDDFHLTIVGGSAFDPAYAERCRRLGADRRFDNRVVFEGVLSPAQTIARMETSNILISSSVMESYGMALAEARTLGLPIVAVDGGNVAALVAPQSGGEVVSNAEDLVMACLALARHPVEHRLRIERARAHALPARPWTLAAQDFVAQAAAFSGTSWRTCAETELCCDGR